MWKDFFILALMQTIIESVKLENLPILTEISRTTFYDTFHHQNNPQDLQLYLDNNFNNEALNAELKDENNHFFFARNHDEIVGYLKLSSAKSDEVEGEVLEISRIYVRKESLGLGVGKDLMDFAVRFSRNLNKNIIYLGVWEHNVKAINFYKKFGFKKIGEHPFLVGNDVQTDWLMKKDL